MKKRQSDFRLGAFTVKIAGKFVRIETDDGQWRVRYGRQTWEYSLIIYLKSDEEALRSFINLLYSTRLIAQDNKFLRMYVKLLKKHTSDSEKLVEVNKKEDKKIIEDEHIKYEEQQKIL